VPGLDPAVSYRVDAVRPGDWAGTVCTGAVLEQVGLPAPARRPESVLVVHLRAS
jgi:hypothetical protein